MRGRSFPAAAVLGFLACGAAKADVTYTFFDQFRPTVVDLDFTVATQLSPTETPETFLGLGGVFASDFAAGQAVFLQLSHPQVGVAGTEASGSGGGFNFTSLPSNAVPGNGSFTGSGQIADAEGDVVELGSATVSGVPVVPEPATWLLLSLGFLGLASAAVAGRRPGAVNLDLL